MSIPNSITRIITAILIASTTMAILFVGISHNMNIAYALLDDSGTSIIDLTSLQGFNATQNNGDGCDNLDGDAVWCV
jgi:hypothetical protein